MTAHRRPPEWASGDWSDDWSDGQVSPDLLASAREAGRVPASERAGRWLRELGRAAAWHRRLLVALLLAGAGAFALQALTPPGETGVPVIVAAHDLPAGARLSASDVAERQVARGSVPHGAVRRRAELSARTLVGPMRAGEVITDVRLVGPSYLEAYGAALVAAPVRIADAASVRLLQPGDVIDVLAAGAGDATAGGHAGQARVVASDVQVITVPREPSAPFGAGGADLGEGALVVIATTSGTAADLAGAAVTDRLSVVIRSR